MAAASRSAKRRPSRIGLLTYHRSVNDGSIMQAYCLYQLLRREVPGALVEIIDYMPTSLHRRHQSLRFGRKAPFVNARFLWAAWNQSRFLRRHCRFSRRRLISDDLAAAQEFIAGLEYDVIVVGSDAAWELDGVPPPPPNAYYRPSRGVPAVAFAVSADPVPQPHSPWDARAAELGEALMDFRVITVRDEATRQFVVALGIAPERVGILPDPTLLWDFRGHLGRAPRLGSGQRPVAGLAVSPGIARLLYPQLVEAGFDVLNIMGAPAAALSPPAFLTIQGRLALYAAVDAMFTDRFHMTIFALKYGSGCGPVVFLEDVARWPAPNSKGRDLLSRLGLEELVWRIDQTNVAADLAQRSMAAWPRVSSGLAGRLAELRAAAEATSLLQVSTTLRALCQEDGRPRSAAGPAAGCGRPNAVLGACSWRGDGLGDSGKMEWDRRTRPLLPAPFVSISIAGRTTMAERSFVADLAPRVGQEVLLRGWVRRIRETKSTTFILVQDASGIVQVVADPAAVAPLGLKSEDTLEVIGCVRSEARAKGGFEVDYRAGRILAPAVQNLPFTSAGGLEKVRQEVALDYRPLALRTDRGGTIFRVQAALVAGFREGLRRRRFTEIFTSKIVSSGTEGGANLFAIQYFDRTAFLAQSPQFYKEHGVAGLERVFETAHVYRAEPHATSRHLTEYYSLDLEMGFISGAEEVIQLERELLTEVFTDIRRQFGERLNGFDAYLPSLLGTPTWEFGECLDRLASAHGRTDLGDDLDPEAERQLCAMAEKETGVAAVFVLGFPMSQRPFYTHPADDGIHSAGFDLLLRGLEVTTGGQRLHQRSDLENALRQRGLDPGLFEAHLRMFDLGMPPHGGLAIGSERLTAQVLGLGNVREATLYPRDRYHLEP